MGTRQKKNRSMGSHVESLETRTLLSSYGIDKYFGNNGVATIQYNIDNFEPSTAVATLPDGRIYETAKVATAPAGNLVGLARLNFNGQVDPTFGNNGIVTTNIGFDANGPNSIVIQNDGKIVVGASTYADMALIRYNTDGSLDTTFGSGGIVIFDLGYSEGLSKILLQPDGKILAIGGTYNGNHGAGVVARFSSSGQLDGSWGGSGYITSDIGPQVTGTLGTSTSFNDGALLPDGRVVVSGMVYNRPLLERFNPDGSLDATFGNGGIEAPTNIGGTGFNSMSGIALAPDGGYYAFATNFSGLAGLSKWTSSGAVDTSWGSNGIITFGESTSVDPSPLQGNVLVQPDQSVLVAVDYFHAAANAPAGVQLCTIAPDGKSTPYSFFQAVGNNGNSDTSEVALQPDGRALIATSFNPSPNPPPTGGAFLMRFRTMADPPEGVRLEGSILTVLGENAPSTVSISLVGSDYSVTLDGNTELFPTASVTQIDVRLLGNGNSLTSGPGVPMNLVDMGYGVLNTAEIDGSSLYLINAGLGSDRINLPAPTDGSGQSIVEGLGDTLNLTGTDGNDDFNVGPTTITAPGRQLTYSSIANINIVTGNGDDTAEVTAATPSVTITGGNGNDVFSVVGSANIDFVNAGSGTTQLIATATPNAMLLFDNSRASSSSVKVLPGASTSQSFTIDDQSVTTADRYTLSIDSASAVSKLEFDGGSAGDTYTMASDVADMPTVINAGTGPVKYLAANVPLQVSSDVTFNGNGISDSATLSDSANTGGLWHGYTIGGGRFLLDGVPGFQYSKIGTLNFTTNNVGSFTNVLDAAGMSVLNVTGGTGSNVFETSPPSSGLGMTARSTINFNGSAGGPNTFIVTPDPNATYNLTGGAGYRDALHVNFTANSGAALHTTGVGSGQYTFTSLQPINFTGIGSLNDLPSLTGPAAQFKSSAPQSLTYVFSSDVGSSIKASSLVLTNTSTNTVIPSSDIALSYNASTFTATFTFPGFAGGVLPGGNYVASIPAGSISNSAHHALAADDDLSFTAPPHRVVSQFIFYNGSYYDGNLPAPNSSDSSAIATDKFALLPGQTASFANYTSYDRGINGLMVDAVGLLNNQAISASDFTFRIGNNSSPDTWAAAPAPSQIVIEPGKGNGGSDRIEILWPDRAIADEWLQVTVLPTANTGFASPYVFYFGNAIGETGNSRTDAYVDGSDYAAVRDNPRGFLNRAPITDPYDFNKDSFVDGTDLAIARDNTTNFLTVLKLITAPAAPISSPTIALANSGTSTLIAVPAGPTGSNSTANASNASHLPQISTMTIASERQYLISLPQTPAVLRREILMARRAAAQNMNPLTASGLGQGLTRLTEKLLK